MADVTEKPFLLAGLDVGRCGLWGEWMLSLCLIAHWFSKVGILIIHGSEGSYSGCRVNSVAPCCLSLLTICSASMEYSVTRSYTNDIFHSVLSATRQWCQYSM